MVAALCVATTGCSSDRARAPKRVYEITVISSAKCLCATVPSPAKTTNAPRVFEITVSVSSQAQKKSPCSNSCNSKVEKSCEPKPCAPKPCAPRVGSTHIWQDQAPRTEVHYIPVPTQPQVVAASPCRTSWFGNVFQASASINVIGFGNSYPDRYWSPDYMQGREIRRTQDLYSGRGGYGHGGGYGHQPQPRLNRPIPRTHPIPSPPHSIYR